MRNLQGVFSIVVLLLHVNYAIQNAYTLSEFSQDVAKLSRMVTGVSVAQDLRQGVISEREAVGRLTGLSDIDTLLNEDPAALANDIKTALEKVPTKYEDAFRDVGWIEDGLAAFEKLRLLQWSKFVRSKNDTIKWLDITKIDFSLQEFNITLEISNTNSTEYDERLKFDQFIDVFSTASQKFDSQIFESQNALNTQNTVLSTFSYLKNVSDVKVRFRDMIDQSTTVSQKVSNVEDILRNTDKITTGLARLKELIEHLERFVGPKSTEEMIVEVSKLMKAENENVPNDNRIKNVFAPLISVRNFDISMINFDNDFTDVDKVSFLLDKLSKSTSFLSFFIDFSQCTSQTALGGSIEYDKTLQYFNNLNDSLHDYLKIFAAENSPFNKLDTVTKISNFLSEKDQLDNYINTNSESMHREIDEYERKVDLYNNFNLPNATDIKTVGDLFVETQKTELDKVKVCVLKNKHLAERAMAVILSLKSIDYESSAALNSIRSATLLLDNIRKLKTDKVRSGSGSSLVLLANGSGVSLELQEGARMIRNVEKVYNARADIQKLIDNSDEIGAQIRKLSNPTYVWNDEVVKSLKSVIDNVNSFASSLTSRPAKISDYVGIFITLASLNFPSIDAGQLYSNLTFLSNIPGIEESVQTVGALDLDLSFVSTQLLNSARAIPALGTYVDNLIATPTFVNNPDAIDDPEMASSGSFSTVTIIVVVLSVLSVLASCVVTFVCRRKIQEKWKARKNKKKVASQAEKNVDDQIKFEKRGKVVTASHQADKVSDEYLLAATLVDEKYLRHEEVTAIDMTSKVMTGKQKASMKEFKKEIIDDEKIRLEDEKMLKLEPLPLKDISLERIMATKDLTAEELEAASKRPPRPTDFKGPAAEYDSTFDPIIPTEDPPPGSLRPEATQGSMKSQQLTQKPWMELLKPNSFYVSYTVVTEDGKVN